MDIIADGIHPKLTYAEYDKIDATNVSKLKELARSPLHYQHRLDHPRKSQPLTLGSAAHTAILEPHRFMAEYALWDERTAAGKVRPRRGVAYDAFVANHPGQRIIRAEEFGQAMAMRDAVRGNRDAMKYLRKGQPEVSAVWFHDAPNRVCKGRVDWTTTMDGGPALVGLKTARDVRPIGFGNQAARLGYHLHWAFYHDGWVKLTGETPRLIEIVVESAPPYDVVVYLIPAEVVEAGRDEYERMIALLNNCEATGEWPGTAAGEQVLSLPSWVYHAEDDIGDIGLEIGHGHDTQEAG